MTDTAPQNEERNEVDLPRGENPTAAHIEAQGQQNATPSTGTADSSEDLQSDD